VSSNERQIPEFSSEDAARAFWATHDSSEYLDWSAATPVRLPNLKPSTSQVSDTTSTAPQHERS
jgi:hypothetical protein